MNIQLNEQKIDIPIGVSVSEIVKLHKPGADIVILNGFPTSGNTILAEGDSLFLIKRGEVPTSGELERTMMARHTPGVHDKLKVASVGIAGAGGLGSVVAIALARVGVGRIVVADFDIVEPSNLNRQQYFIDQIGLLKVDALSANLQRINPYIKVETHALILTPENIPEIFKSCSIVVEAFDKPEMKAMIVDSILTKMPEVKLIAASGLAGFGSNNSIETNRLTDNLYLVGDGISAAAPGNGLMAPRVGIAASHQANQVIRILLGEDEV